MPYLPPPSPDGAEFPRAYDADLELAIRLIEERWRRFFPRLDYRPLNKLVTPAVGNNPVGAPGTTQFDPVWGEAVPVETATTGWRQPHLSAIVTPDAPISAVEPQVYQEPRDIHGRVERVARKDHLQKLGFDRIRDLLVTIPSSMLDSSGITVTQGDRFVWDNELYEVLQWSPMGWWMNSSVKLFIVLNVAHARKGS